MMNSVRWRKFLERDLGRCLHCGETVALAPNHRVNRGMGGSRLRDVPSNIVVLCSVLNDRIESDPAFAAMALHYGWKLKSWQSPVDEPIYDLLLGEWFILDDDFGRTSFSKV